jgi:hypothetical protein
VVLKDPGSWLRKPFRNEKWFCFAEQQIAYQKVDESNLVAGIRDAGFR